MKCQYLPMSASGQVKSGIAAYHGYIVTTVTATAAINIRDGGSSGTIVDVIPSGTAAGASKTYMNPVAINGPLYFDLNGATGAVNVLYE